jgi:hypothetical protein
VGVAILSIVIISCLSVFNECAKTLEETRKKTIAITLAQKKMEEILGQDYAKKAEEGDFSPNFPDYKFVVTNTPGRSTNWYALINIKLSVAYKVKGTDREFKLESNFLNRKAAASGWR